MGSQVYLGISPQPTASHRIPHDIHISLPQSGSQAEESSRKHTPAESPPPRWSWRSRVTPRPPTGNSLQSLSVLWLTPESSSQWPQSDLAAALPAWLKCDHTSKSPVFPLCNHEPDLPSSAAYPQTHKEPFLPFFSCTKTHRNVDCWMTRDTRETPRASVKITVWLILVNTIICKPVFLGNM